MIRSRQVRQKRAVGGTVALAGVLLSSMFGQFALPSTPAAAQEDATPTPRAVLIFDGSGSMWGRLGADNKFTVASRILAAALPSYDREINIGLVAYGHRREADCNDIQVLAAPGPRQSADVVDSILSLTPRGKTPIASSLESAATLLSDGAPGHIVVLTDGTENCRKDLCETVDAVREAVPAIRISTIALGVATQDIPSIQCIAKRGGGRTVVARTQDELRDGVIGVLGDIASGAALTDEPSGSATPRVAALTPEADAGPPRLELRALQADTGPLIEDAVRWRVTPITEAQTASSSPLYAATASNPDIEVPPGRYRVEASIGDAVATREISATDGGTRTVHLPLGLARLDLATGAPLARGETIVLTPLGPSGGGDDATSQNPQPVLLARTGDTTRRIYLPPGAYTLRHDRATSSETRPLNLAAGDAKSARFTAGLGTLGVTARLPSAASTREAGTTSLMFTVEQTQTDSSGETTWREVARSAAPTPVFQLEAGSYRLTAHAAQARVRRNVNVLAGRAQSARLDLTAGRLKISATDGSGFGVPTPVRLRLVPTGDIGGRTPIRTSRWRAPLVVPAGAWEIEATAGDTNVTTAARVNVPVDGAVAAELVFSPGRLEISYEDGAPPGLWRGTIWSVVPLADTDVSEAATASNTDMDTRSEIWRGSGRSPRILLGAGRYRVVARRAGKASTKDIEIVAGLTRNIRLPQP
ncbi:MAG: vWA domain-containing protein [Pseudomonadota bacterium]